MKKISFGICCFNEVDNVRQMYEAITKEIVKFPEYDYDIVFSDNASEDGTQEVLRDIASHDKRVKVIINQINFGIDKSTVNCIKHLDGDAVVCLTCDFQDPPEMIPQFIEKWKEGYDVVWGQKTESDENKVKRACRSIYYDIINSLSEVKQIKQVIGFGLMDRMVVKTILTEMEQDPYVHFRHLVPEYGFKIYLIPYRQRERRYGKSSYNLKRYFSFALTSLCNTSIKPLRMMTVIGMMTAFVSIVVAIFYLVYKLTHWYTFDAGMAPIVIGLFFVAAVQLFCIGILGEYIGILIRRVTKQTLVVEKEKINFEEEDGDEKIIGK